MSAPISSFSKLSLSHGMEPPRGQGRGLPDGKGKGKTQPEDDDSSVSESSSGEDSESDDEGEENTFEPPNAHIFAIDHCRQYGSRYAFQVADAEVQRCGIRLDDSDEDVTCSCDVDGPCRHTQWLLGQLSRSRKQVPSQGSLTPHGFIASQGLDKICESLGWEFRDGPDPGSEEPQWKLQKDYAVKEPVHQTYQDRAHTVRDILAALSNTPTEDFRKDIFQSPNESNTTDIFVLHDLEATVSQFLLLDNDMFRYFQALVKPDARASSYFQNMARKAQDTLDLLDKYCDVGPTASGGNFDLIWCAQRLSDIVDAISRNVIERQPLHPSSRQEAARALVSILARVVKDRNHDVYQNLSWHRRRTHGEPQVDRNLYQRLIGATARPNNADGMFVLNALQDLPEAKPFVDDLEVLYSLLDSVGWSAPKPYLEKLASLITRLKGGSGPTPSPPSTGKRSAGAMDRTAKRMK